MSIYNIFGISFTVLLVVLWVNYMWRDMAWTPASIIAYRLSRGALVLLSIVWLIFLIASRL